MLYLGIVQKTGIHLTEIEEWERLNKRCFQGKMNNNVLKWFICMGAVWKKRNRHDKISYDYPFWLWSK